MTECGACLDTYWLMADERAGLCPLCMTPDKMRADKMEKDALALTLKNVRQERATLEAERDGWTDADMRPLALNHLRAYLVCQGLPADPVVIADPHLAALYEALA